MDEDYPPKKLLLPETLPVAGKASRPRTRSLLEDAIANGKAMESSSVEQLSKSGDFRGKVWDEQSSSWEIGKSKHTRARQEYFGTSVLFPLGDPKSTVRPDYNTSTGQYGITKASRPQTALVDLHTQIVAEKQRKNKTQRGPPVKNHVTFIPQQEASKDMRWAGIDANSMLRNSTPNTRTRWNRNASSIAWHTTSLPASQYTTTAGSESNLVYNLAKQAGYYHDADGDKNDYNGEAKGKKRTDTMVSGDAPAWFQMKHIPVKKLNSTQLSTLLDWNAPIPEQHVKPGLLKIFGIGGDAGGANEPHPDLADSHQLKVPSPPPVKHKTNPPTAHTTKARR